MVDKFTGDPLRDVLVENIISSWNYSQINIPGLFLEIGVYKLTYYLTLECSKIFPLTRSDFTHVEIIAVSLVTSPAMDFVLYSILKEKYTQLLQLNHG